MKHLLVLLILLFVNQVTFSQSKMKFKVAYAELYATYDFLSKLSDSYPDNALKSEFSKSRYNTETCRKMIRQLDTLKLDYTYYFEQYPPTLKNAFSSRSQFEKNLIDSQTITEFKTKSFGVVPNNELTDLSNIIETFVPIYNELIYQPNKASFQAQISSINSALAYNDVATIYHDVMRFYGTAWDKDIPFEVIAYPSIGKSGIGARAFLNISVIRFPLNFKSYDVLFSVMLHEIFHIGYDSQPIKMKNNMKAWFENTLSNNSQYAFLLLNEVLATAMGNGYAYEKLKGSVDTEDWYYTKYVNLLAREIYPVVCNYLAQGKTIDEEFIKTYVNLYDTKFSSWSKELDNILTYRAILCDDMDDTRYFRRNYPYSIHKTIMEVTAKSIEELQKLPITKVIIISGDHTGKLKTIKNHFPELKDMKFNPKLEFIKTVDLEDRTKLLIISRHASSVESLMKKKFPERKLD